ncbi:alpha/beta fold hydrolase [Nonomuraea fuscirosea]|uniref:alpha/beta fold hydrolase n=1 Tax=Nonomuraea fuscirosea TaxID=1291556 RepID=UPI0037B966AC
MFPDKVYGASTRVIGDPARTALLLPGRGYNPARPLLHLARKVLLSHDWTVQEIWWDVPGTLDQAAAPGWVAEQTRLALAAEEALTVLLVGKSLGTLAAPLAAERGLPAVWITPLLHIEDVSSALTATDAPTLLIGGTADPSWPAGAADRTGLEYLELPGADHGLELRGDAIGSAEFLVRVTAAMEAFVGGLSR